jgi:hypothetical protein
MKTKLWSRLMGIAVLSFNVACSEGVPTAPSSSVMNDLQPNPESLTSTTYSVPVVTLMSDLTASPSQVTVRAGYPIKMVNNSGRYRTIHSYNCSEFNMMNLTNGGWLYTEVFWPAGKTCDYFAWDVNWSKKILEGQVTVGP